MRAIALIASGLEAPAKAELEGFGCQLLGLTKARVSSLLEFELDSDHTLARVCYLGRSFERVFALLKRFEFGSKEELLEGLCLDLGQLLRNRPFALRVLDLDKLSAAPRQVLEAEAGAKIIAASSPRPSVNLSSPTVRLTLILAAGHALLGVDWSGFELSRRPYKLFGHPASLRGSIAYGLLSLSGWSPGQSLAVPLCGSGELAIEAALSACAISPNKLNTKRFIFNQLVEFDFGAVDAQAKLDARTAIWAVDPDSIAIRAAKANANAAGVVKKISWIVAPLDRLELELGERSIDHIVASLAYSRAIEATFAELFYQARLLLSDQGRLTLLTIAPQLAKEAAIRAGFSCVAEQKLALGEQFRQALSFRQIL